MRHELFQFFKDLTLIRLFKVGHGLFHSRNTRTAQSCNHSHERIVVVGCLEMLRDLNEFLDTFTAMLRGRFLQNECRDPMKSASPPKKSRA